VPKEFNSPNVPQVWPIEKIWNMLKRKVNHSQTTEKFDRLDQKRIKHDEIQRTMREVPFKKSERRPNAEL
jgi:hypothetical protein